MKTRRRFLHTVVQSIGGIVLLSGLPPWLRAQLGHTTVYRERSFFSMGSTASVSAYGESFGQVDEAINRVIQEFRKMEGLFSVFDPSSSVSKLNACAGRAPIQAEPELILLLQTARKFSLQTNGAFDVTVEPLMRRWGFRSEEKKPKEAPTDRELSDILAAVGHHTIAIDETNGTVGLLHERSALDTGGIAVGFTVDRAVRILRDSGIQAAFVNHSGDAFALGSPEDSDGWLVGIPDPNRPDQIVETLTIRDEALATSGNYRNALTIGGETFGHILNPRSGRADSRILSMTVAAPTATEADALSTGFLSMGGYQEQIFPEKSIRAFWAEQHPNEVVWKGTLKREG